MKYRLLDLLACPMCKKFPLEALVFKESLYEPLRELPARTCEEYCGWLRRKASEGRGDCRECFAHEVDEGILICTQCGRWYPIIEEIPHMLPDDLRERGEDLAFLKKWADKIPERVLREGLPFNLSQPA
ncbi:MAG: Trm112 family protein [Candidatus Nezhaarchaeota archaeon]|nr:Trm112 family protein [Candidatus Nezhaarchaeota archaeon]